jgi:hypothetical protein
VPPMPIGYASYASFSCRSTLMDEAVYMNKRWIDFKVA